ncbi:hypothetical protein [Arcicella lustrica]|uniref:Uncharacterized protein n=1 Tax=Arcicella lustrica TaxID=2984196 RepID=A0ABU5SQ89_9BACT|nr:hypothetical protein [Arcicella sp. DC25W]MEA5429466.1 hypothetical protein [Arcicella sp. DC25W]
MENRIAFSLTEAEENQLNLYLNGILEILTPKSVVLSAKDRKNLAKLGDGGLPFAEKAIGYMASDPQFKPDFLLTADAEIDLDAYKETRKYVTNAEQIFRMIDDVSILSGSEAYTAALVYYRSVKFHADAKQPRAKEIYDDLAKRFERKSKKKTK